jgi:hypothetical protein
MGKGPGVSPLIEQQRDLVAANLGLAGHQVRHYRPVIDALRLDPADCFQQVMITKETPEIPRGPRDGSAFHVH